MASDLIERLKKCALGSADEDVMVRWDKIRAILKQDKGGTWPRERFESIIDGYAEDCEDAVKEIESLRTALAIERERAEKAEREVERCHARLEIDHHFVMSGNDDDDLVRVEIPVEDRQHEIDGIECRDATIKILDDEVSAMAASLAEAKRLLKVFAEHMEGGLDLDDNGDELPSEQGVGWAYLTYGDFRAAARFLAQEEARSTSPKGGPDHG